MENKVYKNGIALISEERKRQIEVEKFETDSDVSNYGHGQLVGAAMCYAANSVNILHGETILRAQIADHPDNTKWQDAWPWSEEWDKRQKHDRLRSLVIAGALIAAEIDRLQICSELEKPECK